MNLHEMYSSLRRILSSKGSEVSNLFNHVSTSYLFAYHTCGRNWKHFKRDKSHLSIYLKKSRKITFVVILRKNCDI